MSREKNVHIKRNYFATSHGKGPVDGVGGIVKRFVTSKIMTRKEFVSDVDSFAAAANDCGIEIIVKKQDCISSFHESNKISVLFDNSEKINDVSQAHTLEYINGKIHLQKYEGKDSDSIN